MKFLFSAAVLAAILFGGSVGEAALLRATYRFNGSFAAEESGAPSLQPVNGGSFITDLVLGQAQTVYQWDGDVAPNAQAGLALDTKDFPLPINDYSVELLFKFTGNSLINRRILDVQNRSYANSAGDFSDNGLYVTGHGNLQAHPLSNATGTGTFTNDTYHHVVVTNQAAPQLMTVYLDGVEQFSQNTTLLQIDAGRSTGPKMLHFFLDNTTGSFQRDYSDGSIALIRIWEGALTAEDVSQANAALFSSSGNVVAVPEPSSAALMTFTAGLSLLGAFRKKRAASKA